MVVKIRIHTDHHHRVKYFEVYAPFGGGHLEDGHKYAVKEFRWIEARADDNDGAENPEAAHFPTSGGRLMRDSLT